METTTQTATAPSAAPARGVGDVGAPPAAGSAVVVDAGALERVGTALADGTRRRLLLALLEGPAFPAELADRLTLTRGNVSNHLGCLRGCGLVTTTPVGRRVRYQLADLRLAHALADLSHLVLIATHDGACADNPADCCPPGQPEPAPEPTLEPMSEEMP